MISNSLSDLPGSTVLPGGRRRSTTHPLIAESTTAPNKACKYCGPGGFTGTRIKRLAKVIYTTFLALVSGGGNLHGLDHKPRSFGGKLIVCSITIFSTLFLALYTAKLTTNFVARQASVQYTASTLGEVSGNLCMLGGMTRMMSSRYPDLNIIATSSESEMFASESGATGLSEQCDALALSMRASSELAKHCAELGLSNPNVASITLGQPAAADIEPILSYWMTYMQEDGTLGEYDRKYNIVASCDAYGRDAEAEEDEEDAETQQNNIELSQLSPLLWLVGLSCMWALCEYLMRLWAGDTMTHHEYLKNMHHSCVRQHVHGQINQRLSGQINQRGKSKETAAFEIEVADEPGFELVSAEQKTDDAPGEPIESPAAVTKQHAGLGFSCDVLC